jgi:hypothetical protein
MVTGHFGFAAGVKGKETFVPLWALMLASIWLDVLFIPLFAVGAETIDDAPGTSGGYGDVIIHADYTAEAALVLGGAYLYWRAAQSTERAAGRPQSRANLVAALIVVFGAVVLALDVFAG